MFGRFRIIVIKRKNALLTAGCFLICFLLIAFFMKLLSGSVPVTSLEQGRGYVILAANDLGMHCYQPDYSGFLILPPGNTLKVQVFRKEGESAKLVGSGIRVFYSVTDNTTSAGKTNFWRYAADYGYDVPPDTGITGNGLSGEMKPSGDKTYYEATLIPVTPYNDGSTELNPYQLAKIQVFDVATGEKLAETGDVVVPVSDEMDCAVCHGSSETDLNILKAHDRLSGTELARELALGKRRKCADCHRDNALGAPGMPEVLPLSQAMHGFHADKMALGGIRPECYSCHPGPVTQCYRGVMSDTIGCVNEKCHGDMENVAKTQAEGRQAWLEEPDCGTCHGEKYGANAGKLYRDSRLLNNLASEMNGILQCLSCHNSPHAEWKSANPKDNLLPAGLLGYPNFIDRCTVCHAGTGVIHQTTGK